MQTKLQLAFWAASVKHLLRAPSLCQYESPETSQSGTAKATTDVTTGTGSKKPLLFPQAASSSSGAKKMLTHSHSQAHHLTSAHRLSNKTTPNLDPCKIFYMHSIKTTYCFELEKNCGVPPLSTVSFSQPKRFSCPLQHLLAIIIT